MDVIICDRGSLGIQAKNTYESLKSCIGTGFWFVLMPENKDDYIETKKWAADEQHVVICNPVSNVGGFLNRNKVYDLFPKAEWITRVSPGVILTEDYYTSISIGEGNGPDTLLIGTTDGLSIISTSGETLNNIRFWDSPDRFSAYPNPFFINNQNLVGGDGHVRFIYLNSYESSGEIDIFDFAMDQVIHLDNSNPVTQDENEIVWNGHNEYGDQVANGVYFCRLTLKGKYYWTKLAVIN